MKDTAVNKTIDPLGRIVIPKSIREAIGAENGDTLSISLEEDRIVLRKANPCCCLCGVAAGLTPFKDKYVCADCVKEIANVK